MEKNNPDKLYKTKYGFDMTILMYASYKGNIRIIKMMIENFKSDLEQKDKFGRTCFIYACLNQKSDAVKYLIEQKVDIDVKDYYKKSAFEYLRISKKDFFKLMKIKNN